MPDVGDQAALHQVDDEARQAHLDHVRAHQQDDRPRRSRAPVQSALATVAQVGMRKRLARRVERQHLVELHVVDALGQRQDAEAATVELRVGHGHSPQRYASQVYRC